MKELATPTGDVYKNWDIREDEFYCSAKKTSLQQVQVTCWNV